MFNNNWKDMLFYYEYYLRNLEENWRVLVLIVLLSFLCLSDERLYKIFLNYIENGILLMNRLYRRS